MAKARTQESRMLGIFTSLGDDALLITAMHGTEALGRLFQFELELFSEGSPIDHTRMLGQNVTIQLTQYNNEMRFFNGMVSKFVLVAVDESQDAGRKVYTYLATLVPWTWYLTRTADCRIFQEKTVPEIIEQVFRDKGLTDFENHLTGTYRKWEYCVQYRETDFNFMSRLMENEGIYYYFKHENGKHTLMLCDAPTAHSPAPNYSDLHYDMPDLDAGHDAFIWNWALSNEITSNTYVLTEFDPLQPKTQLLRSLNAEHTNDPATFELFDYPGGYVTGDEGRAYVNVRLEEVEAAYAIGRGLSSARGIFAGATFTLQDHPACDAEEYLITAISYEIKNDDMAAGVGGAGGGGGSYMSEVTCIPNTCQYRTPRLTPKPVVQGPQTALVVGKSGEEIWTDQYGRVKVKFHWDRDPAKDETSSCWIRVSQNWAGKKWGAIFIPRIGQEVIVDFLEGDPDRPIITGRVYNGDHMPPYDLPANGTRSTIKSDSTPGHGGFNEIRYEDKKDNEQIFINAHKRMDIRVGANYYETNGGNREEVTGYDDKGDRNVLICKDHNFHLKGDEYFLIDKGRQQQITNDSVEGYCANFYVMIKTDYEVNAQTYLIETKDYISGKSDTVFFWGTQEVHIKGASTYIEGTNEMHLYGKGPINVGAVGDVSIKGANVNIEATSAINLKSSMAVNIEGATAVNIKMGGNFVALGPAGIAINGAPTCLINSGGSAAPAQSATAADASGEADPATDHDITAPIDAAAADTAVHGSGGGWGGASRTHSTVHWQAQHASPPPPPPPPPHQGPAPNRPAYARMIRIEWVEAETWCSEGADIRGDTANYGDPDQETVTVKGHDSGSTVTTFPVTITGQSFSKHWEVLDVMPPTPSTDHLDLDGSTAGMTTPTPLKVHFIPMATKTHYAQNRAHFDLSAKDFVMKIESTIEYVKGYMAAVVKLGASVPAGTGGALPNSFFGGGYRWMKKLNGSNVWWDGSTWQPMPATFVMADAVRFTVGFYKSGSSFVCQYGGNFPEALPEWDITTTANQNKIKAWENNIKNTWTHSFDIKRHQCRSSNTRCCRYQVECAVTFHQNTSFSNGMTIVATGNDGWDYRSNDSLFMIDEPALAMAAHEFGHHLGNPDEYAGSALGPAGIDNTSLMGNVATPGTVKPRHFGTVCQHFASMVSSQFGKSYTYDAVPHI